MGFFFAKNNQMNYWILKSEPTTYAFETLEKDGSTMWDGVRNYAARNNLREMKIGDLCFFYHSNIGKEIVGIAKVIRESYQDPGTTDTNWLAVDIAPYQRMKQPVTLERMKQEPILKTIDLIRIGRLSVSKISQDEFNFILALSEN